MATVNIQADSDWELAVGIDLEFLLSVHGPVEIAVSAADDTEPTVNLGHVLVPGQGLVRAQIGPGSVWVKKTRAAFWSSILAKSSWVTVTSWS